MFLPTSLHFECLSAQVTICWRVLGKWWNFNWMSFWQTKWRRIGQKCSLDKKIWAMAERGCGGFLHRYVFTGICMLVMSCPSSCGAGLYKSGSAAHQWWCFTFMGWKKKLIISTFNFTEWFRETLSLAAIICSSFAFYFLISGLLFLLPFQTF